MVETIEEIEERMHYKDEIYVLQKRASELKNKCTLAWAKFTSARTIAEHKRVAWEKCRDEYEKVDRELAEVDGRLQVITHTKKSKPIDPVVLTMEQIKSIAEKVGINIEDED